MQLKKNLQRNSKLGAAVALAVMCMTPLTVAANSGGLILANTLPNYSGRTYIGEFSATTSVSGGDVTIDSGYSGYVMGGGTEVGDADNNKVTFSGGTVTESVYAGYSKTGTANHNTLIITGTGLNDNAFGGRGETGATYNTVNVNGGSGTISIYGGFAVTGNNSHNTVNATAGSYPRIFGAYGGTEATYNTVNVTGGTFLSVCGSEAARAASYNTVNIEGGTVTGDVYGASITSSGAGDATYNTVNIRGGSFDSDSTIYGGRNSSSGSGDVKTGNTLNMYVKGLTIGNIKNFENLNFYLPEDTAAGDTILTCTESREVDLQGSKINVGVQGSAPTLQVGDKITLIHSTQGFYHDSSLAFGKLQQGVSLIYGFDAAVENGDDLTATVNSIGPQVTDQAKSPVETQLAAAAFINSGADMVTSSALGNAVQSAGDGKAEIFGAMSGSNMRYKSGSYADVHGYNLALGAAKAVTNNSGKLTYGPFVEYGYGNYTSHLDSGIRGDGNTKYYGIGMLARQDNNSGLYYEGSLRYGRLNADYNSSDLIGSGGTKVTADYDSSSAYYGAHLGIGKVNTLSDTTKSDLYAKLFYTHQTGDSVALGGVGNGETYDFDAIDSMRARLGGRLSKAYSERGTGYVLSLIHI